MSANKPRVSAVLPVYNAGKYLCSAVPSVLDQRFSDFELMIVDDGSTDGSLAVLQRFAVGDERIRLRVRENRGLVATLDEMLADARGELIVRMDADDFAFPDRFGRCRAKPPTDAESENGLRERLEASEHPQGEFHGSPVVEIAGDSVYRAYTVAGLRNHPTARAIVLGSEAGGQPGTTES